ncbi:MAG: hypothetical protein HRU46_11470 [Verrucomicrobiales bacterium]|nr:hypothetical protein [Verrucomicrobiales bacterium]
MTSLSHAQWERINFLTFEVHAASSEDDLIHLVTEVMPLVIGNCYICWNEYNEKVQVNRVITTQSHDEAVAPHVSTINAAMATHPIIEGLGMLDGKEPETGVHSITDFVSNSEWKERAMYREAYRHVEADHQLLSQLTFNPRHGACLTINSPRPFPEEQRMMVEILGQHLMLAYQKHAVPADYRSELLRLSPRLQTATRLLIQGYSRKEVASQMNISVHTVNDYAKSIYEKFRVHSQSELICLLGSPNGDANKDYQI